MILKKAPVASLFIIFSFLMTACGGGGSSTPSTAPIAIITAADELVEGTTFTALDASNSSDNNGTISSYVWAIDDNGGITGLSITDTTSVSTQLTGMPATLTAGITITVSLIVTDNDNESSTKITKEITLKNDVDPVDVSDFDGIWNSPCFNNSFGYSVRQTINISGGVMTSNITSHTAGASSARNCVTPSNGITIDSQATTSLNYGSDVSVSNCLNEIGVNTAISVSSVSSNGNTYTTTTQIQDALDLLTGYVDILPNASVICRTADGNLLFGGYIYTPVANNSIVDIDTLPTNTDVTWQAGSFVYNAGISSVSANNEVLALSTTNSTQNSANGNNVISALTLTYSLSGAGLYNVVDNVAIDAEKEVKIFLTIGTNTGASTSYQSIASSGNVAVTVDNNGKYHLTIINPITLEKGLDFLGGIANPPATISFTMNNIFDFSD